MVGGERPTIVGVMGSGTDEHVELAEPLGRWLADSGYHLLTGGGGGVMESVSRAFHSVPDRRGTVIAVLPGAADSGQAPSGYPNRWVEIPILTHLPLSGARGTDPASRNHINVLSSDVVVALPGHRGTASEVALALHYGRPVVAWLPSGTAIPGLSPAAPVVTSIGEVRRFVLSRTRSPDGR